MLQHKSGDPHVVGRDGSALFAKLPVNGSVMMSCLFIGVEHSYPGFHQETAEHNLVSWSLTAHGKSCAEFSEYNEREMDFVREFDRLDYRCDAPAQVGVTIGIESQPHGHISSSIES
jgi:hypothetical protein